MKMLTSLTKITACIWVPLLALALAACGDSASPVSETPVPTTPTAPSNGAVDPALTGTWTGEIQGVNAFAAASGDLTMRLNGDGTASVSSTSPPFQPVNGTWGVSGNVFRASGPDASGTTVTFTAARGTSELNGTFSTSSGASGTFRVAKQ